ncbi:MAG: dipeptide epimerase [Bacteroidota bacterium]
MIITKITCYQSPIALKEPFVISLGPLTYANNLLLKVESDTGLVGWGEASPFPTIHGETMEGAYAIVPLLAGQLLGKDPRNHAGITKAMDRAITGNACCKSAFDLACYDLAAQAAGQPLFAYLNGERNETIYTDYTVSLGPVTKMVEKALWIKSQGFPVVKLKLGAGPEDVERVRRVRAAIGPNLFLRIDANQGWRPELAGHLLQELAIYDIQHCEAPIPRRDFLALPKIRAASPIPIMADEACWDHLDAQRLIDLNAIDRINIKLSKSAGLFKALKILRLTEQQQVPVQIGGFLESRLGFTAAAHLACCSPQVKFFDFDTPLMQSQDPIIGGIQYGDNGKVSLPKDTFGLGAQVEEAYLHQLIQKTFE